MNAWVKQGTLLGISLGEIKEMGSGECLSFVDKDTFPARKFTTADKVRVVPGGSSVRTGAYIAPVFENDFPFRTAILTFKGYTKADAFLSYERALTERVVMVLFGGADNLFDRKYFENGFRAPGIVGRGGASLRF